MDVLPLFGVSPNTPCCCNNVDSTNNIVLCTEDHILNCGANNEFTRRHDAIKEVMMEMFRSANLLPVSEKQCDIGSGSFSRYDISVDHLLHANKVLHMDITIPNPLAKRQVAASSSTQLAAAEKAVARKNIKYNRHIDNDNSFTPAVIETYGAMHPLMEGIIRRTSHRVNHVAPERATWTAPNFCAYYFQRISCALQKMNASSISNIVIKSYDLSKSSQADGQHHTFPFADHVNTDTDADDFISISQDHQDAGPEQQL